MNKTAYLNVRLTSVDGKLVVDDVGIFSEQEPTVMGGQLYAKVMKRDGKDFVDATKKVVAYILSHKSEPWWTIGKMLKARAARARR